MSVEAITWALQTPLTGTKKLLLIGLANHATAEFDHARPAVSTLARYASVHERNVQKALRELEADGWIEVTGIHAVQGRRDRAVRVYRLCLERGGGSATALENGVALASERGGAGVSNGVAAAPPEPSFNRPEEPSIKDMSVERVWEHYQATIPNGRRYTLTHERRLLIERALKLRPLEEVKQAITGLSLSDYHVANGYLDVKYAVRGGGHHPSIEATVDRLVAVARAGHSTTNGNGGGILSRQVWPDGRSWGELTRAEQENAKEAVAMGLEPWRAGPGDTLPSRVAVTNGLTSENFLDDDLSG